jgi:pleckstrin homology domain-containing family G member 5
LGPLDANTDIGSLAGRTLIVTEKDFKKSGHYLLQKAASVGYKNSKQSKLFSSASTEESPESHETVKLPQNKQTTKQRWSLQFFGIKVGFNK